MLNGSCVARTPPPRPIPDRLRNVRRSIVRPSMLETLRVRRLSAAPTWVDLRVSMASSSDLGSAVVVADVLRELITLLRVGNLAAFHVRVVLLLRNDCGRSRCGAGGGSDQEAAPRQFIVSGLHTLLQRVNISFVVGNLRFKTMGSKTVLELSTLQLRPSRYSAESIWNASLSIVINVRV